MRAGGFRDYYTILGIARNAKTDEIKRSFRQLAQKWHPDLNPGDKVAEERFKEVSEAYEVLGDPEKREKYDQYGHYWSQSSQRKSTPRSRQKYDVQFGEQANFDDFINDLLGRFRTGNDQTSSGGNSRGDRFTRSSNFGKTHPRLDAQVTISINFLEAFHGVTKTLLVNDVRVEVKVPSGMKTGSKLRVKGKGNLQSSTGRRGDLYLIVDVRPHPIWERKGNQIHSEFPLSIDEFVLGAEVLVQTPEGESYVKIPPKTLPGQSLKLKGKGWPSKDGKGDLILTLKIELPDQWSSKELELFEEMRLLRNYDPRKKWLQMARF